MIDDYIEKFYTKLASRSAVLKENKFEKAKEIAAWKETMAQGWDAIEVINANFPEKLIHNPQVGEDYELDVVLDVKDLKYKGVGVEMVVTRSGENNKDILYDVEELQLVKSEGTKLYFNIDYQMNRAGSFKYAFRMFPKNEDLPHRMDFCFVRWI